MTQTTHPCLRLFPRPCSECGQARVHQTEIAYDAEIKHDGKLYALHIPRLTVNKCNACGEVYFDAITSDEISGALRKHLGLLSPREIREQLSRLHLTQKEFSERICIAAETVSRWLSGAYIQSRAYDKLMRQFFELEVAKHHGPQCGCDEVCHAGLRPAIQS
jgi:DNA-binding transcriptional regulator YiaG